MVHHFFAILKCNSWLYFSSCLILLLPADQTSCQRNGEENSRRGLRTNKKWPICKKKFGNNDKFEFSNFFSSFPTSQNDYQCFGNMDYCRPQFGCRSFIILLVVRYRSIQSKTTDFWLAFVNTEFSSGEMRKFKRCLWLLNKVFGFIK